MAALRLRVGWGTIGAAFLFESTARRGFALEKKSDKKKKKDDAGSKWKLRRRFEFVRSNESFGLKNEWLIDRVEAKLI